MDEEGEEASLPLEDLCHHDARRTLQDPDVAKTIQDLKEEMGPRGRKPIIDHHIKYGVDGSGLHLIAQQSGKLLGEDGNCIASSMNSIQMTAQVNGKTRVVHRNPLMNSPMANRPIQLKYIKETTGTFHSFHLVLKSSKSRIRLERLRESHKQKFRNFRVFVLVRYPKENRNRSINTFWP